MPTNFTDRNTTLIDNIFTNQLDNRDSGVLTNSISDHQMLFSYSKNNRIVQKQVKFIEVEIKNTNALNALLREVESIDFEYKLNFHKSVDPNANFDRFMGLLSQAKLMCMPKKIITFDKKKHKSNHWMTRGILNSLNSKNKLYNNNFFISDNSPYGYNKIYIKHIL